MIYEIRGEYLKHVLDTIDEEDGKKLQLTSFPAKGKDLSENRFLLVDFHEWLSLVCKYKNKYSEKIDRFDVLDTFRKESGDFLTILNYRMYKEQKNAEKVLNYSRNKDIMNLCFIAYSVFMSEMQELQLKFLNHFKHNNNSIHPVGLMPFSYALNRIARTVLFITNPEEDELEVRNMAIDDSVKRLSLPVPLYLVSNEVNIENISDIPERWKSIFNIINPNQSTYKYRVELLKKTYSQYKFYGFKNIPELEDSKVFLMNFPFMYDKDYFSNWNTNIVSTFYSKNLKNI